MTIRNSRRAVSLQMGLAALLLVGCSATPSTHPAGEKSKSEAAGISDDARKAADQALGKQAAVIAHGDLARNDSEQLLVVNPFASAAGRSDRQNPSPIFITRAAVLEKSGGQWTEVLRCDEHLKNPNGYLGGSPAMRVNGWRLEFRLDMTHGLELKFTPVNVESGEESSGMGGPAGQTVVVRWNTQTKRYQSLDASHERYLSEAPTLETPHSILR